MNHKKAKYLSALAQLPIEKPTREDMARLCPHLAPHEAVAAFMTGNGHVACPPIRVHDCVQRIFYRQENHRDNPQIDSLLPKRITEPCDDQSQGDKHIAKAVKFAQDHWGDDLVRDDWACVIEIFVQDPTDLVSNRRHKDYPRTKAILCVALTRDLSEIINDPSNRPQSELFDKAISQMTLDRAAWHEIKGGRGAFTLFNCAHCGAGLSLSACTGCGHRFRDDQFRRSWRTPLSRKMVTFLRESGHTFGVNPGVAWQKERREKERREKEQREKEQQWSR